MSVGEVTLGIRTSTRWAEVMLLLVAVVWGASYGLAKTAVLFYPVLGFLAVRFCLTSLLLLPTWRGLTRCQIKTVLKVGVPLGLILLGIFISETYGVSLTLASNAAFLGDVPSHVANGRALLIDDYAASPVQARPLSLVAVAECAA
jgi:hypothetical protein